MVSSLNITNRHGLVVQGHSPGATVLLPTTGGVNVLHLTGSDFVTLRGFQLGDAARTVVPNVGILVAQAAGGNEGSSRIVVDNLQVTGRYGIASVYNFGVAESSIRDSAFWQFLPNSTAPAVIFTSDNRNGVASAFATIATGGGHYPADWTLSAVGLHNNSAPSGPTQGVVFVCRACTSFRMLGGVVAGAGPALILFEGEGANIPMFISFIGTGFYSDNGTPPSTMFLAISSVYGLGVSMASFDYSCCLSSGPGTITWFQ